MRYAKEGTTVPIKVGDEVTETATGKTWYIVRLDHAWHVWVTPDQGITIDSPAYLRPISLLGLVELPA